MWSLLRLSPQKQNKYADFVSEYYPDVELYWPVYERKYRPSGIRRVVKVILPVYPGYIFVRGEGDYRLVSGLVRARWVRFGEEAGRVSDLVVQEIRRMEKGNELMREEVRVDPVQPGVQVRVHLPIYDLISIVVKRLNGNRVQVLSGSYKIIVSRHALEVI